MEYKTLREEAFEANMEIARQKLAKYTWGNASAFDPDKGVFAIKPSGVPYEELKPESMVVIDLTGHTVDSTLRPSSDTETHRILYLGFPSIRGICHTHSTYAVAWAQSRLSVPVLGTTHADHNTHEIPCTGFMSADAVKHDYELETGNLIIRTFQSRKEDPDITTMVLVAGHGPFTWGESAVHAVYHSAILEEICKMAYLTLTINPRTQPLPEYIIHKHWERKHGAKAYYGQK